MKGKIFAALVIALVLTVALALGICAQSTNGSSALEAVFGFKGYSISPTGEDICVGFNVDYEAMKAYENEIGRSVEIGITFASYEYLNGQTPLATLVLGDRVNKSGLYYRYRSRHDRNDNR